MSDERNSLAKQKPGNIRTPKLQQAYNAYNPHTLTARYPRQLQPTNP